MTGGGSGDEARERVHPRDGREHRRGRRHRYQHAGSVADGAAVDRVGATRPDAMGVPCDVTDRAAVEHRADDAWVATGTSTSSPTTPACSRISRRSSTSRRTNRAVWVLDVNLMGVWYGCGVFGKRFVEQEKPRAHPQHRFGEQCRSAPHAHGDLHRVQAHGARPLRRAAARAARFRRRQRAVPGDGGDRPGHGWSSPSPRFGGPAPTNPWLQLDVGIDPEVVGEPRSTAFGGATS